MIVSYDIHNVDLSISVNTGMLPDKITELPVATKVSVGTNIFLSLIPNDLIVNSKAEVQELVAMAYLVPTMFANLSSNSFTFSP